MQVPVVRLRHKKKGTIITVNEADWARDLGLYKWSAFDRVGESHNGSGEVLQVTVEDPPQHQEPEDTATASRPTRRTTRRSN